MAQQLGLTKDQWSIAFQSRLGKIPWIEPYADQHIESLAEQGIRKIQVSCPAFATDCLETLEEINLELRETFVEAGGEEFHYSPCLNASDFWTEALVEIINELKEPLS